jgi:3-methyladenine DNA glycosylase/8-oxoguanine DNA glycosylase
VFPANVAAIAVERTLRRMISRAIALSYPVDLRRTIFPLVRGNRDPTTRVDGPIVWRALRTTDGPATLRLTQVDHRRIDVDAWGPGADRAVADTAPGLAGALDEPEAFVPRDVLLQALWRDHRSVLLTRSDPFPVLIAAILEQKVTGFEARKAWREIVLATSDPAPGEAGLRLPPDAERLASIPSWRLTKLGVVHRRAATLREAARHPKRIASLAGAPREEARAFLGKLPGVGPWTIAEVSRLALGDPDAVSVGDYHLPHIVSWAFAGEPRGTDERMLELLEPYRGQRGRVEILLEASGITAPAFGPKMERRSFV